MSAVLREEETVTPLELFFDLVFVLALTQCTALMAAEPTWEGLAKGLLVLGVMWWSWVGYTWLTSVVDPEEGAVRLVIFAAMAAFSSLACASQARSTVPRSSSHSPTAPCAGRISPSSCSPAATTRICAARRSGSRSAPRSASA